LRSYRARSITCEHGWQSYRVEKLRREIGRPKKTVNSPAAKSGWPDDPEERSREMKRRLAVAREKKTAAKGAGAKRYWDNMSVRERRERLAKMQAGRKKPSVKMEPAA
jgi:hypothetical protein